MAILKFTSKDRFDSYGKEVDALGAQRGGMSSEINQSVLDGNTNPEEIAKKLVRMGFQGKRKKGIYTKSAQNNYERIMNRVLSHFSWYHREYKSKNFRQSLEKIHDGATAQDIIDETRRQTQHVISEYFRKDTLL